ncbi:MAG TPA: hypothetical protein VFU02_21940 [Polyangiaceae bacterium]|nr:hypothetical protein [Polyangiaceae bacterium]
MSKAHHAVWLFCLGVSACGSGEAVTNEDEFGAGYRGGSEPPPATQRGESTPAPNFSECPECSNACLACIENAGEDETESLLCLIGPVCKAYFAQYTDSVPEYGVADDNILDTPDDQLPPEDCTQIEDPCLACECFFGPGATECVEC